MKVTRLLPLGMGLTLLTGCVQTGLTKPPRSATEQLLLSTAADRALAQADLSSLRAKKVFVDRSFFDSLDDDYVVGTLRDLIGKAGGLLAAKAEDADIVLEPRSGALSIDAANSIVGIPASAAPIPLAGAVQLPEVALYKSEKQYSIAKIALLAYERQTGRHFLSGGPYIGRADIKYYTLLGYISYTRTSLPEKTRPKKETR